MKLPLSWVSLYTDMSDIVAKNRYKDLAHLYSIHTAEIDGIEIHDIDKVVVGKVLSCEKHPDSKKLSIVQVSLGEHGNTMILTGAPNIAEATYVPVAMVGAVLGTDFHINDRMMAGYMSSGMICGSDEIGLSTQPATGIMILEEIWDISLLESMVGKSLFTLTLPFPLSDGKIGAISLGGATFEIDNKFITNRPDLFSIVGNAREFGAVFSLPFHVPKYDLQTGDIQELSVSVQTDKVLAYHAVEMQGLSAGISPFGLRLMLERSGIAPNLDLVDITNLVMTELGQPMHVYDRDRIEGDIVVRFAKEGETMLGLDDKNYIFTSEDIVIADSQKVLALAGIIGGKDSSVTENTTHVIFESACFDPVSVRLSGQRHGIRTDASMRFEKSLDPLLASEVWIRVNEYLRFLEKTAVPSRAYHFTRSESIRNIDIDVTYEFLEKKSGLSLDPKHVCDILTRLGFGVTEIQSGIIRVHVPSWRATKDIDIKEDIAEEIMRIIGYDAIEPLPLTGDFSIQPQNPSLALRDKILSMLSALGGSEVYNYSFTDEVREKKALLSIENAIGIKNAVNTEDSHMRTSVAPRLFESVLNNLRHETSLFFYEIGTVSVKHTTKIPSNPLIAFAPKAPFFEEKVLGAIFTGTDLEHVRGIMEKLLDTLIGYVPPIRSGSSLPFLHPGVSGVYHVGDDVLMSFGKVHPEVRENFSLPEESWYFEGNFDLLMQYAADKELRFASISRYQTIPRELNFVMDSSYETGPIASRIEAIHPWIGQVRVDSVFSDDNKIGQNKKSVNFSFLLSRMDGTISDEEALEIQNQIIETLKAEQILLRGI